MSRRVSLVVRRLWLVAVVGALAVPTMAAAGPAAAAPAGSATSDGRQHGPRLARGEGRKDRGDNGDRGDRGDRGGRLSPEERKALRDRVQQKIQTYLTVELSSRAGLDEKKSLQLGAAIKAQMERRQATREKKRAELEKLRELVQGKAADAALKAQVKAVVDQSDREEQMQALLDDTAKFLTPLEQAKIVVAWPEVMKDTRRLIGEARGGGGGGHGGGHGGGGGDGNDDE